MWLNNVTEKVNSFLFPILGPPPLGPYETTNPELKETCPLCGELLTQHPVTYGDHHIFMKCPYAPTILAV